MTNDIVTRLRFDICDPEEMCVLRDEAADEIARLRAALETMQRSRDRYREAWEAEKTRATIQGNSHA